jgi:raffinose/stachyose/melibiose transport system permease protein
MTIEPLNRPIMTGEYSLSAAGISAGVRRALGHLTSNLLAVVVSLIMLTPVALVFINALKTKAQASSMGVDLPTVLQWQNFATVIERGKLVTAFGNSVLYAIVSTVIGITLSALAAYILARNRTWFNQGIYFLIVMGIAMPTNFVTLTQVMQMTHLINTQLGIIILYAASHIPLNVFLIYAFIGSLPRELDEAAIIDGCSPLRLFFSIIYPLLTPVLVTAAVLNLLDIWNEFLLPLYYLNKTSNWPMTLAIYNFFGQYQSDWSLVSADIVLTILPVIMIYLLAQRYILSGLTIGAIKG